jgi:hypothetical protein
VINADDEADYKNFSESLYGAIFFGVPSQGMETAALESVVKDQANLPLIINLRRDVNALTHQSKSFNKILKKRHIHMEYYYEKKESPQMHKVGTLEFFTLHADVN